MKTTEIVKWLVSAMLVGSVIGSGQDISVEHKFVPARLEALRASSSLHYELQQQHYDHALSAMMLVEDIDMIEETTGMTALGLAAKDESADAIDMVQPLVLKYGADPKLVDAKGYTALHYASAAGNYGVVEFLANLGADVDAENVLGENRRITPLYMAHKHGRPRIAEFLRMRGAADIDPEIRADLELTDSMAAAAKEHARKLMRDAQLGVNRNGSLQDAERKSFLAISGAAEKTLREQGNLSELEAIQKHRARYLSAIDNTEPETGMSRVEYGRKVKETLQSAEEQARRSP